MVVANSGSDNASVHLGRGDGTFDESVFYDAGNASYVALGDLDGDGALDMVLTDNSWNSQGSGGGGVSVHLGRGDGCGDLHD